MNLSGEQRIAAPRERVWAALNDPEVLRQCIPGCQSLDKDGDQMRAVVEIKIGPIGAQFNGIVKLSDINPPSSYTISGQGQGGTVGTAKGGAKVRLEENGDETVLSYTVEAEVGGRLAQLGGPIIDATAKQLAGKFFRQFGEVVAGPAQAAIPPQVAATTVATQVPASVRLPAGGSTSSAHPVTWLSALLAAALVGYLVGHATEDAAASEWIGLAIGLLVVIVGACGFEFGRRMVSPVIVIEAEALQRLAGKPQS